MKKAISLGLIGLVTLVLAGCPPLEVTSRNGIAAASGFIVKTELEHPECAGNRQTPAVCKLIQDGIKAVNVAADAENAYCSGTPGPGVATYTTGGPCTPIKDAGSALQAALINLNQVVSDIKGAN